MPTKTKAKPKTKQSVKKPEREEKHETTHQPEASKPHVAPVSHPPAVPHIDIPGGEPETPVTPPAWHTADDLPSFAKPANVPTPIPPSQVLSSEPPPTPASMPPAPVKSEGTVRDLPSEKPAPSVDAARPPPMSTYNEKWNTLPFLLGGIVFGIIVLLAVVAVFFSFKQPNGDQLLAGGQEARVTPAVEVASTVSLAPTPASGSLYNRSDVSFEVLNSSGVKGAAGAAAQKLAKLGFTILRVGNATVPVAKTELAITSGAQRFQGHIVEDVSSLFPNVASASGLTDKSTTASARLTVGKDQAQ